MTFFRLLIALLFLLPAAQARAQYVATPQPGVSYPALTSPTPIALVAAGTNEPKDRGRLTIPIGFSFPFYNRVYTQVTVTANGVLFFEPSSANNSTADFSGNVAIPGGAEPNGVVAPLWDDLDGSLNPNATLQTQALTGSNGQGLAVEFKDWNRAFGQFSLTFQVRLWANGVVEFYYGPMTGSGATDLTASIGIESPSGTAGTRGLTGCSADCSLTSFDPGGTGTPISYIRFGPPAGVDLQALALRVDGITQDGGTLTFDTSFTLRNFGTQASGPFAWALYLSEDTLLDGADVPLAPPTAGPLTLPSLGVLTTTASGSVERPDAGSWYVLASIPQLPDGGDINPFNNVVASSVPYAAGVDLIAESVTPPPVVGPGEPVSVPVSFSNQGFEVAGGVTVKLYASVDTNLTSDDRLLTTESISVLGGQQVQQALAFTLPLDMAADDYFVILQLDDGPGTGTIPERNEGNNLAVSSVRMQVRQADLVVTAVRVQRALPPYDEVSTVFFGDQVRLEAQVSNVGGATAPNVRISFFMSDNESLNAITDLSLGNLNNESFAPGETRWVALASATLPTQNGAGQALAVQPYFFFAAAVGIGLREDDPTNNFRASRATVARNAAPNLVAIDLQAPSRAGAGEVVAVARTLGNFGNRDAPTVTYRYYLSANTIITRDDVPLMRVTPTGEVLDGQVSLAIDQRDSAVELVRLPATLAAAPYYLGVLADPDGLLDDADPVDNGLAAPRTDVVPQSLGLANAVLPDGTTGQPYLVQLQGVGGGGAYTFALKSGASLPAGLTLSGAGELSGTPTAPGAFTVRLLVRSGTAEVEVARPLRVAPPTGSLAISTRVLPAPTRLIPYDATLGAAGGAGGYVYSLVRDVLPAGLQLLPEGRIVGTPTEAIGTSRSFVLRVTDAIGNIDDRAFTMTVVDGQPFTIATRLLPDALVETDYLQAIVALNPGGAPVSTPVRWQLVAGELPPGLGFEASTSDTIVLSGSPTRAGRYRFTVEAVDAQGRADAVTYLVSIGTPGVIVTVTGPARALPGDEVTLSFNANPVAGDARWWWKTGRLPPGLAFSSDGTISGTVASDAPLGLYTFTLAYGGSAEQPLTLTSRSLEITLEREVANGCVAGAGGAGWVGLLGVFALLRGGGRRRKSLK
jgi:hypothetical protein